MIEYCLNIAHETSKVPSTSGLEKDKNTDTEEYCQQLANDPLALDDRNSRYIKNVPTGILSIYAFGWILQTSQISS